MLILKNPPTLFINVFQDVADEDIGRSLQSPANSPLHIVVLTQGGKLSGAFIVGDTVFSAIDILGGISSAVWKLIATYYNLTLITQGSIPWLWHFCKT